MYSFRSRRIADERLRRETLSSGYSASILCHSEEFFFVVRKVVCPGRFADVKPFFIDMYDVVHDVETLGDSVNMQRAHYTRAFLFATVRRFFKFLLTRQISEVSNERSRTERLMPVTYSVSRKVFRFSAGAARKAALMTSASTRRHPNLPFFSS